MPDARALEDPSREVRIALVLYGGVSLAIYENGVTRCFFDLVRRRGIFALLLELLDASAVVDVIAGTSAGGINGLLLAAALESGAEFAPTADLWRANGDFGALLRRVDGADDARSLLDGEGYYQRKMIDAFHMICTTDDPQYECPSEIDVFITGTDFNGRVREYWDALGTCIRDKDHRVVFHLKHRPERKWLGLLEPKTIHNAALQATILGAIARITSSFPIAFPPFSLDDLDEATRPNVGAALARLADEKDLAGRHFVDGGVLDNKPFGPALRAIFYRMPDTVVDRRLFYVEPDPQPFVEPPVTTPPQPMAVGIASLTTIPSHESIGGDLKRLTEHNARVAWLKQLQDAVDQPGARAPAGPLLLQVYAQTRAESLARSFVLTEDQAPAAEDLAGDPGRRALLDRLRPRLLTLGAADGSGLDPFDVNFHLRRAFHLLYELYNALEGESGRSLTRSGMRLIGRVIKAFKLVRDMMLALRDHLVPDILQRPAGEQVDAVFAVFQAFLGGDAPHWSALQRHLDPALDLAQFVDREQDFLSRVDLSAAASAAWDTIRRPVRGAASDTVLDRLGALARRVILWCEGESTRFDHFVDLDRVMYPLGFAGGVHELDQIEYVRISPADAQRGLSRAPAAAKVTGDELGHFAAFLRRDWRANDILWGRLDGISSIVESLLDADALARLQRRADTVGVLFTPKRLAEFAPNCAPARRERLAGAWQALAEAWRSANPNTAAIADEFREQLILAGQEDAFQEDYPALYADIHYQDIAFGMEKGPRGTTPAAAEEVIAAEARKWAKEDLDIVPAEKRWPQFDAMDIGLQAIVGEQGRVPPVVVGQYFTTGYLLIWGMLRTSLPTRAREFLDHARVRRLFRDPIAVIHYTLWLIRREYTKPAVLIALGIGLAVGLGVAAASLRQVNWLVIGLFAFALFLVLFVALITRQRWRKDTLTPS